MRTLFEFSASALLQAGVIQAYNVDDKRSRGWQFCCYEFADFYCQSIAKVMYPPWYAACFVADPTHAAMWAHYGDSHRGVCLKFRAHEDSSGGPALRLNGVIGTRHDGKTKTFVQGQQVRPLSKVIYTDEYPEIEFFSSLGRTPRHILLDEWYTFDGERSPTSDVLIDEDGYRKRYWKNFEKLTTMKLQDWDYENEYRLIANPILDSRLEDERRVFTYDFADLEGIIFGINTSLEDKTRIMKIVDEKCQLSGRDKFEFFQAAYSTGSKKMDIVKLTMMKFTARAL